MKTRKVMMFTSLFLSFGMLFLNQSYAQSIKGKLIDAQTKEALIGANIIESDTQNGSSSNEKGEFELKTRHSSGQILISFIGYKQRSVSYISPNQDLGEIALFPDVFLGDEYIVKAQRVEESTPMAFKTVTKEALQSVNVGQDLPYLLQMTPSLLSSSDAGLGVGYTYMSIRGVDQARINVTINGIPANDAESHGVWWVNMPDLASSMESIQVQRGVGTSTNGAAAFGASINVETNALSAEPFAEISTAYGSYQTMKRSVLFGTGMFKNGWSFDARLSQIESDGYVDRASSDLQSYFLNAAYSGKNELLKINVFSGKEKTYQAWYGTPEALVYGNQQDLDNYISRNAWGLRQMDIDNLKKSGRRYNYYLYDNETDNYHQQHVQIHYSRKFSERWNGNISLHFTKGAGYYETYKVDADYATYNLQPQIVNGVLVESSDLIRREWLDNQFYGFTYGLEYRPFKTTSIRLGGALNNYDGDHFGEVIWAEFMGDSPIRNRYYENNGIKLDGSSFVKVSQTFGNWIAFADVQFRYINYQFEGFDRNQNNQITPLQLKEPLSFVNPKLGLTWNIASHQRAFISFSVANKEATRKEYVSSVFAQRPRPETLYDWELGYQIGRKNWNIGFNAYLMQYRHQLLETGAINDVGEYVRQNVENSYRSGIELSGLIRLFPALEWSASATLSQNRVKEIHQFLDNYDLPYMNGLPQQEVEVYRNKPLAASPDYLISSSLKWSKGDFTSEWMSRYVSLQYLDNSGLKSRSIPSFFVNDIRFSYQFRMAFSTIECSLFINNIFNELYASRGYTFSYISGAETITENYYYPQAERHLLGQVRIKF